MGYVMRVKAASPLLLATALTLALSALPLQAKARRPVETPEFTTAMARVFPEYRPGSPQYEAISHRAADESGYQPCRLSRAGDEGVLQWRGPRRAALHAGSGVPMADARRLRRAGYVPPWNCVSMLDQMLFARREWKAMREACAAFERAHGEALAYRIFDKVFEHSRPLSEALYRKRVR